MLLLYYAILSYLRFLFLLSFFIIIIINIVIIGWCPTKLVLNLPSVSSFYTEINRTFRRMCADFIWVVCCMILHLSSYAPSSANHFINMCFASKAPIRMGSLLSLHSTLGYHQCQILVLCYLFLTVHLSLCKVLIFTNKMHYSFFSVSKHTTFLAFFFHDENFKTSSRKGPDSVLPTTSFLFL